MARHARLPLNDHTLDQLADRAQVPTYDRSALTPAVVHISVGGFARAHQLVYSDELAERGETGWGGVGVGLHSPTMRDALAPQDHLFTVVERNRGRERARVVGSMVDVLRPSWQSCCPRRPGGPRPGDLPPGDWTPWPIITTVGVWRPGDQGMSAFRR